MVFLFSLGEVLVLFSLVSGHSNEAGEPLGIQFDLLSTMPSGRFDSQFAARQIRFAVSFFCT